MRIGIDVDGVLANFFEAYENLTIEVTGVDLFGDKKWPAQLPQTWNWPETFGYTKEQMNVVWSHIKRSTIFWSDMQPFDSTADVLHGLANRTQDEIYFITDRPGDAPQLQTSEWIDRQGFMLPSVIISGPHARKGQICAGLALDAYLDDKGENILDVLEKSPATRASLLAYPYNTEFQGEIRAKGGRIIASVNEFLNTL